MNGDIPPYVKFFSDPTMRAENYQLRAENAKLEYELQSLKHNLEERTGKIFDAIPIIQRYADCLNNSEGGSYVLKWVGIPDGHIEYYLRVTDAHLEYVGGSRPENLFLRVCYDVSVAIGYERNISVDSDTRVSSCITQYERFSSSLVSVEKISCGFNGLFNSSSMTFITEISKDEFDKKYAEVVDSE